MKKILKRINLDNVKINFEYKEQCITIKAELYNTLEYIKEKALKKMDDIPPDVHCYYLGIDLSSKENRKIGDLFYKKEKATIKLSLPPKQYISPNILSDRSLSVQENSSVNTYVSNHLNSFFNAKSELSKNNIFLAGTSLSPKQSIEQIKLINSMGLMRQNLDKNKKIKILNCKKSHFLKKSMDSIFKRSTETVGLPNIFSNNKTINSSNNFTLDSNINHKKQNSEFPLCNCKRNKISLYCRNCKDFICAQCRESIAHKKHLTILLNQNNLEESIKIYLMIVLTDIQKKRVIDSNQIDNEEKFIDFFDKREKQINGKFEKLNELCDYYFARIHKAIEGCRKERTNMLVNAYERGSIKINKELYKMSEIFKDNYIKKHKSMTFEQLEQYFESLNNKEEVLSVLSSEMIKFHLIYEIKNKLNNTLNIIENTLDEINNEESPFNLKKEENDELLKILQK
jgi:hypothetical protein